MVDFAAAYERVDCEAECKKCGACCINVPYLTETEKTRIIVKYGEDAVNGNNLARNPEGFCIFHTTASGKSFCGLHGADKPTSCQAYYCEKILEMLYGLSGEQYHHFINYRRRTLRIELEGRDGIGYD